MQNITIPMYTSLVYTITNALEEKEREEFTRLKVIKRMKTKKQGGWRNLTDLLVCPFEYILRMPE